MKHSRESLDALHACMFEWFRVAVERLHTLGNRALIPLVNSVGDEAKEVDVHLLLFLFFPVAAGRMGECEVLSVGVAGNHWRLE